jgi:hypothetical protein
MCFFVSVSKQDNYFGVFPLFIYGVFILWVIWVNKFSLYAKILLTHKFRFIFVLLFVFFVCPYSGMKTTCFTILSWIISKDFFAITDLRLFSFIPQLIVSLWIKYGIVVGIDLYLFECRNVKFAAVLYAFFFVVLIFCFYATIHFYAEHNNRFLFADSLFNLYLSCYLSQVLLSKALKIIFFTYLLMVVSYW